MLVNVHLCSSPLFMFYFPVVLSYCLPSGSLASLRAAFFSVPRKKSLQTIGPKSLCALPYLLPCFPYLCSHLQDSILYLWASLVVAPVTLLSSRPSLNLAYNAVEERRQQWATCRSPRAEPCFMCAFVLTLSIFPFPVRKFVCFVLLVFGGAETKKENFMKFHYISWNFMKFQKHEIFVSKSEIS